MTILKNFDRELNTPDESLGSALVNLGDSHMYLGRGANAL